MACNSGLFSIAHFFGKYSLKGLGEIGEQGPSMIRYRDAELWREHKSMTMPCAKVIESSLKAGKLLVQWMKI